MAVGEVTGLALPVLDAVVGGASFSGAVTAGCGASTVVDGCGATVVASREPARRGADPRSSPALSVVGCPGRRVGRVVVGPGFWLEGPRRGLRCRGAGDSVPDELDDEESESVGSAQAMPWFPAIAAPTPSAAASTPTRPI